MADKPLLHLYVGDKTKFPRKREPVVCGWKNPYSRRNGNLIYPGAPRSLRDYFCPLIVAAGTLAATSVAAYYGAPITACDETGVRAWLETLLELYPNYALCEPCVARFAERYLFDRAAYTLSTIMEA